MKKNYKMKRTISLKQFISEFGEDFSDNMKNRLLELGRCVLVRKEDIFILNLKHVEHTKHLCSASNLEKEFVYSQFVVIDGVLYLSERCTESAAVVEAPIASAIYSSLSSTGMTTLKEGVNLKKIDDSNIDFVVDSILSVCPEISKEHLDICSKYDFKIKLRK